MDILTLLGPLERANLNHWTMDKVHKPTDSECYTPSSEPFRISRRFNYGGRGWKALKKNQAWYGRRELREFLEDMPGRRTAKSVTCMIPEFRCPHQSGRWARGAANSRQLVSFVNHCRQGALKRLLSYCVHRIDFD
jgi:hypothetical protein